MVNFVFVFIFKMTVRFIVLNFNLIIVLSSELCSTVAAADAAAAVALDCLPSPLDYILCEQKFIFTCTLIFGV